MIKEEEQAPGTERGMEGAAGMAMAEAEARAVVEAGRMPMAAKVEAEEVAVVEQGPMVEAVAEEQGPMVGRTATPVAW